MDDRGELVVRLQRLPRDTELQAMEPGLREYCEREIDEIEWQGGRVYLHLGARAGRPAAPLTDSGSDRDRKVEAFGCPPWVQSNMSAQH